jgi:peptide/nickel transport system ATP-binding protein
VSGSLKQRTAGATDEPLLSVRNLTKHFPASTGFIGSLRYEPAGWFPIGWDDRVVRAVDGVSFDLYPGETFGVVGESGCGKSTLARTVLGLEQPTAGEIQFMGGDVSEFDRDSIRTVRRNAQIVFQDPGSSLNPRRKVGEIIADPLEAAGRPPSERRDRALELLDRVGLEPDVYNRYPHEFSGGQKQRINLARALSINPDLVVADEPVSGLDMSVQAQILTLMEELQAEFGLTYLLITHDLSVIRQVTDRVVVMYVGEFVETGPTERLFTTPHHPYTRALLDAIPNPNPDARAADARLEGDVPSPSDPPPGCTFHTRCPELIPPEGFTREGYRAFAGLREDVAAEALSTGEPAEATGEPTDAVPDERAVLEAYFEDVESIPRAARSAVREALDHAGEDAWDAAREALAGFESPCESIAPPLEFAGEEGHRSACHLPVEDREPYEW